jgi:outer membrane protein assembly factor BamB
MDKRTGKELWRVTEPGLFAGSPSEWIGSWSTPVVAKIDGQDQVILSWPNAVKAYDPKTGSLIWHCRGLTKLVYSSPLFRSDIMVAMSGFSGSYMGLKPGGKGDVTDSQRLWHVEKAPQRIGSGVIVGEHVYIVNENGTAQCIELKTGKTLWQERATGGTWGSMVCADGKLYVTSQQGETVVLAAKPVFEVLSRNALEERSQSSLAVSNGQLFLRTYRHLWCIGSPKQ